MTLFLITVRDGVASGLLDEHNSATGEIQWNMRLSLACVENALGDRNCQRSRLSVSAKCHRRLTPREHYCDQEWLSLSLLERWPLSPLWLLIHMQPALVYRWFIATRKRSIENRVHSHRGSGEGGPKNAGDGWGITRIMVDQMNRWILVQSGFIGSFDLTCMIRVNSDNWSWSGSYQRSTPVDFTRTLWVHSFCMISITSYLLSF